MVKFKLFIDKDEEVKFLNEQAAKGNAFRKFFLGFYFFDKSEENKYVYDIDLLSKFTEYNSYKNFMKEANVEVVSRWYRWVYVKSLNRDKGFELYSDVNSKIEHYNKIKKMFIAAFIIELICLFVEIIVPLITSQMMTINAIFIALIVFFAIVIFGGYSQAKEKVNFYLREKDKI